ncbi:MAG: DUF4231 domain-containing protein, partial [Rhabdochlamydiaceae bacterium]
MLTKRYIFKSNELKSMYANGTIDHQGYSSSLKDIKREELASVVFDFKQREMEEEISAFELQQLEEANHARDERKKHAEELLLQIEIEKTKQLQAQKALEEKEKQMQPQSLEAQLLQARKDFYEKEALDIIDDYKGGAKKYRRRHDNMQIAVIAGSALATSTTAATIFTNATDISTTLKIIAAFFSLLVTIASGSIAYFKYKERSNDTQKAVDQIEDEHMALKLGIGPYRAKSLEEALSLFAEKAHITIVEHKKKQQLLDHPPETK